MSIMTHECASTLKRKEVLLFRKMKDCIFVAERQKLAYKGNSINTKKSNFQYVAKSVSKAHTYK
jgi:hypothetical protein